MEVEAGTRRKAHQVLGTAKSDVVNSHDYLLGTHRETASEARRDRSRSGLPFRREFRAAEAFGSFVLRQS